MFETDLLQFISVLETKKVYLCLEKPDGIKWLGPFYFTGKNFKKEFPLIHLGILGKIIFENPAKIKFLQAPINHFNILTCKNYFYRIFLYITIMHFHSFISENSLCKIIK